MVTAMFTIHMNTVSLTINCKQKIKLLHCAVNNFKFIRQALHVRQLLTKHLFW